MPEPEKPFTLGKWKTFTTYQCRFCKFDTTEEDVAWAHFKQHTGKRAPQEAEQAPETPPILVADKRGREVQPEPPVEIVEEAVPELPKRKARKRIGG